MPKLMFDQIERQIINENNSFFASRMRLFIAKKRFEREFMKTGIGRFIHKTLDLLTHLLA